MTLIFDLQKTLYDMKKTSHLWHILISELLQGLRFPKTDADLSIFVFYYKSTFILVYMNNFFIIVKNLKIIYSLKNKLLEHFYITDLRLVFHYLGISITQIKNHEFE